jgi:hypothetical protein
MPCHAQVAAVTRWITRDPETGVLSDLTYTYNRVTFEAHPDTGYVLKGAVIEHWDAVKTFAIQVAQKFHEIEYLE